MQLLMELLESLAALVGLKKMGLIAGGVGAAVSMPFIEGTWRRKLGLFIAGWFGAAFVSPVIIEMMDVKGAENGISFLVGVFFMSTVDAGMRSLKGVTFDSLAAQVRIIFGKGGK